MKKAFDQTIRDLKREVNKKVLKVPSIEQKVLDATSNEPWGPHGSLLADIAQASRNYHEYQMIMTIMWKRINSTGKNWRHVYKALTVLEYLVANGSERAIDEIREHAYQISTLSNFQYIDSSGRDQGLNVRRKSQSLVSLVNDKEKIQEVREKAAANRDKFRSASTGGTHEPGSYSGTGYGDRYDDERYAGRYGSRDDDRNGYGRESEWSNRDDDRYGRNADRYGRDSEERYGRGSYRDDDHRGRYADESGSRSSERDRANDDEHHSRGSSVKAEDHPQEGRPLERKFSEQNVAAPPSYEEAVGGSKSPVYSEKDGETPAAPVTKLTSPTTNATSGQPTVDPSSWSEPNNKDEAVDEFDPRGSVPAESGTLNNAEVDLLGSLSDSWAITPVSDAMSSTDPNASGTFAESQFMTTSSPPTNQSFEDPFGDSPFKAISSPDDVTTQAQGFPSASSFQPSASSFQPSAVNSMEQTQHVPQVTNNFGDLQVQETFSNLNFRSPDPSSFQLPPNSQPMQQEPLPFESDDILAGILPPSGPPPPATSQTPFAHPPYHPTMAIYNGQSFVQQPGPPPPGSFPAAAENQMMPNYQNNHTNFLPHSTPAPLMAANTAPQLPVPVPQQQTNNLLGDLLPHAGPTISLPSQPTTSTLTTGSLALVSQPAPKKFELKSAVWADTLNRGLVDLNISGPKVNPNAGIGVDFDTLNRKERRMEKPTAAPVASTINMGQAMGSGSGMGRSDASMIRPQSNTMAGSGMGMGMGGASGGNMGTGMGGASGGNMGMGMGGAPGVKMGMGMGGASGGNTGMGMGMGMGMGGAPGMGMGGYGMMNQHPNMGMGMGQGAPMMNQHPGSNMSGGYNNPMMGRGGGFPPQQPYGSGYQ